MTGLNDASSTLAAGRRDGWSSAVTLETLAASPDCSTTVLARVSWTS